LAKTCEKFSFQSSVKKRLWCSNSGNFPLTPRYKSTAPGLGVLFSHHVSGNVCRSSGDELGLGEV
jgi:hypothetical protein